jgi:hypothetical protein
MRQRHRRVHLLEVVCVCDLRQQPARVESRAGAQMQIVRYSMSS